MHIIIANNVTIWEGAVLSNNIIKYITDIAILHAVLSIKKHIKIFKGKKKKKKKECIPK